MQVLHNYSESVYTYVKGIFSHDMVHIGDGGGLEVDHQEVLGSISILCL